MLVLLERGNPKKFVRNPGEDLNHPIDKSNRSNGHHMPTSTEVNQNRRMVFIGVSSISRGLKVVNGIFQIHTINLRG